MKEVKVYSVNYEAGDSREVQGKYAEVVKKYGKNWNIQPLGKGNGNYLLTKPSKLHVKCDDDIVNLRSEVLDYYGNEKLTHTLAEKFENQLNNKKIAVFVDDYGNYEIQKTKRKEE